MGYAVFLRISEATHSRFEQIRERLNQGTPESQAKALGCVLSDIACDIIQQVFAELIDLQKHKSDQFSPSYVAESEKAIQYILDNLRKYMPWSVSLLSNERLVPLVNYLSGLVNEHNRQIYVRYPVSPALAQEVHTSIDHIRDGHIHYIPKIFAVFIQIIDLGVTSLIREPKKLLNYNLVVDKTLNGVIKMTTHVGYKRLEKLASQVDCATTSELIDHFMVFMQKDTN